MEKDIDNEEEEIIDELDITGLVDITVRCNQMYFYSKFINCESLVEGLKEIDKAIKINKELITCLDKINVIKQYLDWHYSFNSKQEAVEHMSENIGISTVAANYLIRLRIGILAWLNEEYLLNQNERLLLLKKHLENFKTELIEKFDTYMKE